ncbi:hypothetical protein BCV69DRAFT_190980 [Microstroma glucosiphilum]|uniref:Uncharacterized protein n=1 Tax=Pseudomicrostroma glucosiphilum TaxID=1684307 RepID=A0A316U9S4_9BASI|nr:hypothetical protein BCV69DRAFT_190980 [Pseudomicrostroma glucosiphilum]PWN21231.1 hypothetical protein BCV69DRAFT_190980 [Pseudomicrostroma glucosiphilum]
MHPPRRPPRGSRSTQAQQQSQQERSQAPSPPSRSQRSESEAPVQPPLAERNARGERWLREFVRLNRDLIWATGELGTSLEEVERLRRERDEALTLVRRHHEQSADYLRRTGSPTSSPRTPSQRPQFDKRRDPARRPWASSPPGSPSSRRLRGDALRSEGLQRGTLQIDARDRPRRSERQRGRAAGPSSGVVRSDGGAGEER